MEEIVNKVSKSGIETIDLEQIIPIFNIIPIDLKDFLEDGWLLREKKFRAALKEVDWTNYHEELVTVYCSSDAIVPSWAYMLLGKYLEQAKALTFFGEVEAAENQIIHEFLDLYDWSTYKDKIVMLKGCSKRNLSPTAYLKATQQLMPWVKTLMFGEPCSSVPVFKR